MEVERTLRNKLPEALPVYSEFLPLLNLEVVPLPSPRDLRPYLGHVQDKDAPVLASADQAEADFFISGDKRLLTACREFPQLMFRAAEPAEFLDRILPVLLAGPFRRP